MAFVLKSTQALVDQGDLEFALSEMRNRLADADDPVEGCRLAEDLAQIYYLLERESPQVADIHDKALHYAKLAGEGYIKLGMAPAALRVYHWLRQRAGSEVEASDLLSQFARAFGQRRQTRKTDDTLPPPTPFQEIKASISFETEDFSMSRLLSPVTPPRAFSIFSQFKPQELEILIHRSDYKTLHAEQIVFDRGDQPDAFYLVLEGDLEKQKESGSITLKPEDFFGDLTFFSGVQRQSRVIAWSPSAVLRFERGLFRSLLSDFPHLKERFYQMYERRLYLSCLKDHELFKPFSQEALVDLYDAALATNIPKDRALAKGGQRADRLYFIVQGRVEESLESGAGDIRIAGDFVGLNDYLGSRNFLSTWMAKTDLYLLEWRRDLILDFLLRYPEYRKRLSSATKAYSEESILWD